MGSREVRIRGADWIHLTKDKDRCPAVVNTVMNIVVSKDATNFLTSSALATNSVSRTMLLGVIYFVSHIP
jgi:hypothetical protein